MWSWAFAHPYLFTSICATFFVAQVFTCATIAQAIKVVRVERWKSANPFNAFKPERRK